MATVPDFVGPKMRLSFAQSLFKPQQNDRGEDRWGCTLIIPKADVDGLNMLKNAIIQAVKMEWSEKGLEKLQKGLVKNPLLDGESKQAHDKEGNLRPGMGPDVMFLRPNATTQPAVVDAARKPITNASDCPSGWWGQPVLRCYTWSHPANGDGVSFGIGAFQLQDEDESLGGAAKVDPNKFFDVIKGSEQLGGVDDASKLFG